MTDAQHRDLADVLHGVRGKVVLSSYRCALNDELYQGWRMIEGPNKLVHSVKELRQEVLYLNYDEEDQTHWQPIVEAKARTKRRKVSLAAYTTEPLFN